MNLGYREIRDRFYSLGNDFRNDVSTSRLSGRLPKNLWLELCKAGLFSDEDLTNNYERIHFVAPALEGLCHAIQDGGVAISIISQVGLSLPALKEHGTSDIHKECLDGLLSGSEIIAFAITEKQGGSDAYALQTTIYDDGGDYILRGHKWNITNIPEADWVIVVARHFNSNNPLIVLVNTAWSGVEVTSPHSPVGMRSSPIGSIKFSDVFIPKEAILGHPAQGKSIVRKAFLRERILTPFPIIGCMAGLCERAVLYSCQRRISGTPIRKHQYIQKRITDVKINLESTRVLAYDALTKYIDGAESSLNSSVAKLYAANAFLNASATVMKIFGSHGYQVDDEIGHMVMDAVGASIAGGTEEVHRKVIFQQLLADTMRQERKHKASLPPVTLDVPPCPVN
ncbi:MAG TPA: acyl-CoA/acyl-ACP dehydrogenase [Rhodospirillaceae bacterium]|nr:acyl-CoA/acyl-ACP dehydrogenase [Rhodospirillaceae bacterium]